jgi:hypothetical protein
VHQRHERSAAVRVPDNQIHPSNRIGSGPFAAVTCRQVRGTRLYLSSATRTRRNGKTNVGRDAFAVCADCKTNCMTRVLIVGRLNHQALIASRL